MKWFKTFIYSSLVLLIFGCVANLSQPKASMQEVHKNAGYPRFKPMPNGDTLMSWVEPKGDNNVLKFAVQKNGQWQQQGEVASGTNWFLHWSDFPSVVPITENFWLSHRLVKQAGKSQGYDVVLALSNDAGKTWRDIGSPHRDASAAEHGFAVIFPEVDAAGVIWLDGRDYLEKADKAKFPNKSGNFSLRYTRVHSDGRFDDEQVIDSNTCTCCWPSVAITNAGPVAAWRGHTDEDIRDNLVARMQGGKWQAAIPLGAEGWQIDGCPVNGPTIVARGMQVAAAWFSAEGDRPRVRAAFSSDGGKTFGQPIEIDDAAPLGRVNLVWKDDTTAVATWLTAADATTKKSQLAIRTISTNGSLGAVNTVADVAVTKSGGMPQMLANENGVLLAWTEGNNVRILQMDGQALQKTAFNQAKHSIFLAQNNMLFSAKICGRPH